MSQKFRPMAFGFHSHAHMSLDGGSTEKQKLIYAQELGRPADCLTDHGVMSGLLSHWTAAQELSKKGPKIQSVHGIELYLEDTLRGPKVFKNGKSELRYTHLTVLFKTRRAYEYMCSMTPIMESRAVVKFGERKPILKLEELQEIGNEIIIGSGCLVGHVAKNINDFSMTKIQRYQAAETAYLQLKAIAGNNPIACELVPHNITHNYKKPKDAPGFFYPIMEQNHECDHTCDGLVHTHDECGKLTLPINLQTGVNRFILEMAKKYGDLPIISEDNHYSRPEDYIVQEVRTGNGQEKWKFHEVLAMYNSDHWAKALNEQIGLSDRDIEWCIDNSYYFLDQCKDYSVRTNLDGWLIPDANLVYNIKDKTNREIIYDLIDKHGRMPKSDSPEYQVYKDRVERELAIFCDNGTQDLSPYLFPCEDIASYAKENGILANCRGSAGGSLLIYLLNISVTDPVKFDLPVERFITVDRIRSLSMMDADLDFESRDAIIDYILSKYGDKMSLIGTDLQMKLKSSILDVERSIEGEVSSDVVMMTKALPNPAQGANEQEFLFGYVDKTTGVRIEGFLETQIPAAVTLKHWGDKNPKKWETVLKCIGITKTRGVHAGGVLIMPNSVASYLPLIKTSGKTKALASAYNAKYVEIVGGIKYDILGVKTLKALSLTMKLLKKKGVHLDWGEFPHDEKVYTDVYHTGKMAGIFQTDTKVMTPFVLKMKPRNIVQLSNIIALCRPGTLDSPSPRPGDMRKAAEYYAACTAGEEVPYFIHSDLEPILGDTYGVVLFQEQLLRCFRDLAGYTYETAEAVRRGVSKKAKDVFDTHLPNLKAACIGRGWSETQAQTLCDTLIASSKYSFNRAHSTSYGIVSYNCGYLKTFFPREYWIGMLTIGQDDDDDLKHYLNEIGDKVLPVDIIASHPTDWQIEGDKIRPPLSLLKGVGGKSVHALRTFIQTPFDLLTKELFDAISKDTDDAAPTNPPMKAVDETNENEESV